SSCDGWIAGSSLIESIRALRTSKTVERLSASSRSMPVSKARASRPGAAAHLDTGRIALGPLASKELDLVEPKLESIVGSGVGVDVEVHPRELPGVDLALLG